MDEEVVLDFDLGELPGCPTWSDCKGSMGNQDGGWRTDNGVMNFS